jgi:hypothetical protein
MSNHTDDPMTLFSAVMHVRKAPGSKVAAGLDSIMRDYGYVRSGSEPLQQAPKQVEDGVVAYAYGPLRGDWCTVVQVHFYEEDIDLSDVGAALSELLGTHVLSLDLHDDEVFYYYLDASGEPLDHYDSNPMYFEDQRLSEADIEARRHHPEAFAPLLPAGVPLAALTALLDSGWWRAHDKRELDADGTMQEEAHEADDYLPAEERMAGFGKLLQLHGAATEYPYVAWAEASPDAWSGFTLVTYVPE